MARLTSRVLGVIWLALTITAAAADEAANREALRVEVEQLRDSGRLSIGGVDIASGDLLAELYERRNFTPTWTDVKQIDELLVAVQAMYDDGLDPSDYHVDEIEFVKRELEAGRIVTPRERAALDIMLTDSVIRLGYHQRFGKVNPVDLDPVWNFDRDLNGRDPATVLQEAIDAESLTRFLAELFPRGPLYMALRDALGKYRRIAADGGWPQTPDGATLKPGAEDVRVAMLALRLAVTGDLADVSVASTTLYNKTIEAGIRVFQGRHGLDVGGVVGPATLRALNVTVEQRIEQLRLNLERTRWVMHRIEDDFVIVNIAGFKAYLVRDRQIVWNAKVQVGAPFHKSPVFRSELKYVVFKPTWTVPYSIATREMLPKIKADPTYFDTRDFDVKDRAGNLVDPASIDWSQLSRRNFGYTFVQRAGPGNALGQVKFIFPNKFSVYLHDTPSKALFGKAERAFSHGCIRVEHPFEFAEVLLESEGWDRARIDAIVETKSVYLSKPLPVFLLYWTAEVDDEGVVHFFTDVYERDEKVAKALAAPFAMELPEGALGQ